MAVERTGTHAWPSLGTYLNQRTGSEVISMARAKGRSVHYYTSGHPMFRGPWGAKDLPGRSLILYEDRPRASGEGGLDARLRELATAGSRLRLYRVRHKIRFPREAADHLHDHQPRVDYRRMSDRLYGFHHCLATGGIIHYLTRAPRAELFVDPRVMGAVECLQPQGLPEGLWHYRFRRTPFPSWREAVPDLEVLQKSRVLSAVFRGAGFRIRLPSLDASADLPSFKRFAYFKTGSGESFWGWDLKLNASFGDAGNASHRLGFQYLGPSFVVVRNQGEPGLEQAHRQFARDFGVRPHLFALLLAGLVAQRLGARFFLGTACVNPFDEKRFAPYWGTYQEAGMQWLGGTVYGLDLRDGSPPFDPEIMRRVAAKVDLAAVARSLTG